jgi:TolA-binding protein
VGTPDALVTVHGTAFTVEVTRGPGGSHATSVTVTEGRVSVENEGRQLLLGPGSHWSSIPTEVAPIAPAPAPMAPENAAPARSGAPGGTTARHSTLGAENELFRAAMAASAAGDAKKAIALSEQLLRTYPDSPLASETHVLEAEARSKLGSSPKP